MSMVSGQDKDPSEWELGDAIMIPLDGDDDDDEPESDDPDDVPAE